MGRFLSPLVCSGLPMSGEVPRGRHGRCRKAPRVVLTQGRSPNRRLSTELQTHKVTERGGKDLRIGWVPVGRSFGDMTFGDMTFGVRLYRVHYS